jgi:hypothetical protein
VQERVVAVDGGQRSEVGGASVGGAGVLAADRGGWRTGLKDCE